MSNIMIQTEGSEDVEIIISSSLQSWFLVLWGKNRRKNSLGSYHRENFLGKISYLIEWKQEEIHYTYYPY